VNQFHERMLPATAPARASGVSPLIGDDRQPGSVANPRSGTLRLSRARARSAVPVVIVHGVSDRRNRRTPLWTVSRALKEVRSSAVTAPLPRSTRSGQAT
jgi:hypothetical protein